MLKIPLWVEKGLKTNKAKATARLKFILTNLAARHTGRASLRALADRVGLDHSTLSVYTRAGAFSEKAASTFVANLNDPMITVEVLTKPLEVERETG